MYLLMGEGSYFSLSILLQCGFKFWVNIRGWYNEAYFKVELFNPFSLWHLFNIVDLRCPK